VGKRLHLASEGENTITGFTGVFWGEKGGRRKSREDPDTEARSGVGRITKDISYSHGKRVHFARGVNGEEKGGLTRGERGPHPNHMKRERAGVLHPDVYD